MKKSIMVLAFLLIFISFSFLNAQWVRIGGPKGGQITALTVSGMNLFAGTDKGIFLSTNNGTSWTAISNISVNCLLVSGKNIFAGSYGSVFLSTNNGKSWTEASSGLPEETSVKCLTANGTNLFAGTYEGVFLSTDNGSSWTAVNSGLNNHHINCLAVSGMNLFAGTGSPYSSERAGIFLSIDNGKSWKAVSSRLLARDSVLCLVVSGTNIFAGTMYNGIFLSTDNGDRWKRMNSGLPETEIRCFAVSGTNLFAGTGGGLTTIIKADEIETFIHGGGVFQSTNNGKRWKEINSGLPLMRKLRGKKVGIWVDCLAVSGKNLFAGTDRSGVWRLPLSDILIEK